MKCSKHIDVACALNDVLCREINRESYMCTMAMYVVECRHIFINLYTLESVLFVYDGNAFVVNHRRIINICLYEIDFSH